MFLVDSKDAQFNFFDLCWSSCALPCCDLTSRRGVEAENSDLDGRLPAELFGIQ